MGWAIDRNPIAMKQVSSLKACLSHFPMHLSMTLFSQSKLTVSITGRTVLEQPLEVR